MSPTSANIRSIRRHGETPRTGCVSLRDLAAAAGAIRPRACNARPEMIILLEKHLRDPDGDVREKARSSLQRLAA